MDRVNALAVLVVFVAFVIAVLWDVYKHSRRR
jgi:hypothetical protein